MGWQSVWHQTCVGQNQTNQFALTVLSVYAPQTGLEESTYDAFYDCLETVISKLPDKEIVIVVVTGIWECWKAWKQRGSTEQYLQVKGNAKHTVSTAKKTAEVMKFSDLQPGMNDIFEISKQLRWTTKMWLATNVSKISQVTSLFIIRSRKLLGNNTMRSSEWKVILEFQGSDFWPCCWPSYTHNYRNAGKSYYQDEKLRSCWTIGNNC